MNTWTWWLLGVLILFHLLDLLAAWLNFRSLEPNLPREFETVYDAEEYARLQRYTAATSRVDAFASTLSLVVLVAFWLCGGFGWLDGVVRSLDLGLLPSGLLYIGALWAAGFVISLPFQIYDTFVIEERFGFNKTTPGTFILDRIKSLALTAVLGGAVLSLLLWLLQTAGPGAWLYAWAALSVLTVIFMFFAPAIILPLFNKFTPLPEGELKQAILEFGRKNGFPIAGIQVMDGSRRSTRANAFFTGFGRNKKIVLFDTLIKNHTVDELVAVLAHEIGHFKLRHILQHLALAVTSLGLFLFLASVFLRTPAMFEAFGVERMSVYVGLALFSVLFTPLSRVLSMSLGFLTRHHEYQADAFAAQTTGRPASLAEALKKLSKNNLSNLSPHPLEVVLHHSHPPVLARIQALRRISDAA